METLEVEELIFFDTFSHEASEEINLDLVQFPKPVIISEVRIIPLGARVQADFPGGVRLGATNPSQFRIEFFVNDLSKHGASTFESIGGLEYKQASDIHLECGQKKIPTDGLILRGWYSTITLAVYGSLSKALPPLVQDPRSGELSASAATAEWVQSQQATIYRDPAYTYAPEFPPDSNEHVYIEDWVPATAAASAVVGHIEAYDETLVPNWSQETNEDLKPWTSKDDLGKGPSPIRSTGGDSINKSRNRGEFWDDREEKHDRRRHEDDLKRFKDRDNNTKEEDRRRERSSDRSWRDTPESRTRASKTIRECSWDREQSPYSDSSFRRRPKSPSSRSPKRPSTPVERFWSPERKGYKSPTGRTAAGSLSPPKARLGDPLLVDVSESPETPLQSPVPLARPEEINVDEEQFEPILSDEDIIDESDSQQYPDLDYDFPDDLEDVVKTFNPFTFQMDLLENLPNPAHTLCEHFKKSKGDTQALDAVKELVLNLSLEAHEDWIVAVEQLPALLPSALSCGDIEATIADRLITWVERGLDLDAALCHTAPGSKLRHIKGGVRLAESLCHCGLTERLIIQANLLETLLRLFHREHMALSIRLLILQAVDSTLLDPMALDTLLTRKWSLEIDGEKENGTTYHHLLRMLAIKQQVRVKFALTSLLQKLHIDEVLRRFSGMVEQVVAEGNFDESEIALCLRSIQRIFIYCGTMVAQPRRFLPVQAQFEVHIDPKPAYLFLYRYFKTRKLLESILIILTSKLCGAPSEAAACELLRVLSKSQHGLLFLGFSVVTNPILKVLQSNEDCSDCYNGSSLAVELPFKLHTLHCLDKLLKSDESDTFNILHDLFCVTLNPLGKFHVSATLGLDDNIQIILKLLNHFDKKSPISGYVGDLVHLAIKYSDNIGFLKTNHKLLLDLASSGVSEKLKETQTWIQPAETLYEDVVGLCDLLSKCSVKEFNGTFSGELISCVRCLRKLCLPAVAALPETLEYERIAYTELGFKHSLLQLHSLDGLGHLTALLSKMINFYEQPFVHNASLVGGQGFNIVSFVEPAILLMRQMLSNLIEARGSDYKDVTHVNVLLDVYVLMKSFPAAAEASNQALTVCRHIIETLLVYTHSAAQTDIYAKSLWTLMLSDVLKFILKAPYCFLPGFELLSELLPLPLPMQSKLSLSEEEISELRLARQHWSAHVHPLAGPLHDLFAALAGGSYPPLLHIMRRVAVQLADIAAPTALILARAVLDPLLSALSNSENTWEIPVTPHAVRLLHFLASLAPHPAIKAAVLSLITPGANARTDEKLLTLVDALVSILKTASSTPSHTQAQECVLLLVQALLDADITLIPLNGSPKFLASALPARDLLTTMTSALLDHVSASDHSMTCLLLALKPLILLTDNDYGFYKLKMALESRRDAICNLLSRLNGELRKEHTDALNALHGTLALLREFVLDAPTPIRTLTMTPDELGRALRWGETSHPLKNIHQCLREWSATDESLKNLCESAGDLLKLLATSKPDSASSLTKEDEPVLLAALPLMEQFSARPAVVNTEPDIKSLTTAYWLSLPLTEETEQECEQVPCDLLELCGSFLPDIHLLHEVQQVCRLKAYESDGKKVENSKYQMSGIRTRRPFVTPMRGRGGRPTQQRGDVFRSRPPNTSRPPSLHVDDFVALETCGQQPTGPTGYNKVSVRNIKEVIGNRGRGRGRVFGAAPYPRRDTTRGRGLMHDDLRALPASRFRAWPIEDLRRIHPFPR